MNHFFLKKKLSAKRNRIRFKIRVKEIDICISHLNGVEKIVRKLNLLEKIVPNGKFVRKNCTIKFGRMLNLAVNKICPKINICPKISISTQINLSESKICPNVKWSNRHLEQERSSSSASWM